MLSKIWREVAGKFKTSMEDSEECEGQFLYLSREELFNAFEDFKKDTCTGWRCVYKDSNFGKCIE